MKLYDRLNEALKINKLYPIVETKQKHQNISNKKQKTSNIYTTLKEGIKSSESIEPDEFGTRIIVVKEIEELNKTLFQLPMNETIIHKYIIDDIQKTTDENYEIHLVEK